MSTETIFTSYQPIQRYLALVKSAYGMEPTPAVPIKALDVFLMRQIVEYYPTAPTIIDLAGAATMGVSPVLWASLGELIQHVFAADATWEKATESDWRALVMDAVSAMELNARTLTLVDGQPDQLDGWATLTPQMNRLAPLIFVVALESGTPAEMAASLQRLLALHSNSAILLMPLGPTGESATVEATLMVCGVASAYRFTPMREVSPFFNTSELGIIYPRSQSELPALLERLHSLYDGNFRFLTLLDANIKSLVQSSQKRKLAPLHGIGQNAAVGSGQPKALMAIPIARQTQGRFAAIARKLLNRPVTPHHASYLQFSLPQDLHPSETVEGTVTLRNDDIYPWVTTKVTDRGINVSYHWRTLTGTLVVKEGLRSVLPNIIQPRETVTMPLTIMTPSQPGQYLLDLDMVHETIIWFSDAGTPGPLFQVDIKE